METTSKSASTRSSGQSAVEKRSSSGSASDGDIEKAWHDATNALETLYEQASAKLQREVQERPYAALAAAAGIGFVLGGGLGSATGRFLLRSTAQLVVPGVLATLRGDD